MNFRTAWDRPVQSGGGFSVGDRVRLNDAGLEIIGGLQSNAQVQAQVRGVLILRMGGEIGGIPGCHPVDLEDPFDFMIDTVHLIKVE